MTEGLLKFVRSAVEPKDKSVLWLKTNASNTRVRAKIWAITEWQDLGWVYGIAEPLDNGILHGRKRLHGNDDGVWERAVEEAPADGRMYVRQDLKWVPLPTNMDGSYDDSYNLSFF